MSRETVQVLGARPDGARAGETLAPPSTDSLAARLADLERANGDLLRRVQAYERERVEIRERLRGILSRMGGPEGDQQR